MGALLIRAEACKGKPNDPPFAQALRKAHVDIRVTFGNGSGWQTKEDPKAAVAVRMLHAYFAGKGKFRQFYKNLSRFVGVEGLQELGIEEASRLIRADMLNRGEMELMDNLVLVLGIDEIDKVLVRSFERPEERRVHLTPLMQALGEAMCGAELVVNSSVFLCPLVAGVVVGEVHDVISQSGYSIESLLPIPLNEKEVDNIIKWRQWASDVYRDPDLGRCLGDLGGVPLILEAFVGKLEARYPYVRERGSGISFRAIREEVKAYMLQKVALYDAAEARALDALKELLFAVLWNRRTFLLGTQLGDTSVGSLQASGVLTLNSDGQVLIPIIYLVS